MGYDDRRHDNIIVTKYSHEFNQRLRRAWQRDNVRIGTCPTWVIDTSKRLIVANFIISFWLIIIMYDMLTVVQNM